MLVVTNNILGLLLWAQMMHPIIAHDWNRLCSQLVWWSHEVHCGLVLEAQVMHPITVPGCQSFILLFFGNVSWWGRGG